MISKSIGRGVVVFFWLAAAPLLSAQEVLAPIIVNTLEDEWDEGDEVGSGCSLREAIETATSGFPFGGCLAPPGVTAISLPAGTVALTRLADGDDNGAADLNQGGDLDIRSSLTLAGAGETQTILDGGGTVRIFDIQGQEGNVDAVQVTLSGLTIQNGSVCASGDLGGGIRNRNASLTINNVTLRNHCAAHGGAISNGRYENAERANLTLNQVTLIDNTAGAGNGGGIYHGPGSNLVIRESFIGQSGHPNRAGRGGGLFVIGSATLEAGTSISHNEADCVGGGIFNSVAPVQGESYSMLRGVVVSHNRSGLACEEDARHAGGIYNIGNLGIREGSRIEFNVAGENGDGGGIYNLGEWASLAILHSTVAHNESGRDGGGIHNEAVLEFYNSVSSYNRAGRHGGGFFNGPEGEVTLVNSTIGLNTAVRTGGGIYNNGGDASLLHATIARNYANALWTTADTLGEVVVLGTVGARMNEMHGGGLFVQGGEVGLQASLLHHNGSLRTFASTVVITSANCSGEVMSRGSSIVGYRSGTCSLQREEGSMVDQSLAAAPEGFVNLGPSSLFAGFSLSTLPANSYLGNLDNNGGRTETMALLAGHPGINFARPDACPGEDQRGNGFSRNFNLEAMEGCEAGAFEVICGDGFPSGNEECDDGNAVWADGCQNNCAIGTCGTWPGDPSRCGDGNGESGDGCSSECMREYGFTCESGPVILGGPVRRYDCASACGDGLRASDEACDDGNTIGEDGCSADCMAGEEAETIAEVDDETVPEEPALTAPQPSLLPEQPVGGGETAGEASPPTAGGAQPGPAGGLCSLIIGHRHYSASIPDALSLWFLLVGLFYCRRSQGVEQKAGQTVKGN